MLSVAEGIQEVNRLARQVRALDKASGARQRQLDAATLQTRAAILGVQDLVQEGHSTGDRALDVQIMLGGTLAKNAAYRRLAWLQRAVVRHAGDLVILHDLTGCSVGVLPPDPLVSWGDNCHEDLGFVNVPTRACFVSRRNSFVPMSSPGPPRIRYDMFRGFGSVLSGDHAKLRSVEVLVGARAIQRWQKTRSLNEALSIHVAARLLGQPLSVYPELATKIQHIREQFVVSLLDAIDELMALRDLMDRCKSDPVRMLKEADRRCTIRTDLSPKDGVTITFGVADQIDRAMGKLWEMVDNAFVGLEMEDNPIAQRAAAITHYTPKSPASTQ